MKFIQINLDKIVKKKFLDLSNSDSVLKIIQILKKDLSSDLKIDNIRKLNNLDNTVSLKNFKEESLFSKIKNFLLPTVNAATCNPIDEFENCKHWWLRTSPSLSLWEINTYNPLTVWGWYFYWSDWNYYFYNMFTNNGNSWYMSISEYVKPDPTTYQLINEFLLSEKTKLDIEWLNFDDLTDLDIMRRFYRYFAAKDLLSYAYDKSDVYQTAWETIKRWHGNCWDFQLVTMNLLYNLYKKLWRNTAANNLYYWIAMIKTADWTTWWHAVLIFYNWWVNWWDWKRYYLETWVIMQWRNLSVYSDAEILPVVNVSWWPIWQYTDSYSSVANWSLELYSIVSVKSVYKRIRTWFNEWPVNKNTVFLGLLKQVDELIDDDW